MGHKVHPMGFRIGVIRDWQSKWYADKHYAEFLQEDLKLRQVIDSRYTEAGISQVQIERQANKVSVTIHTARPGIVIGRGGQRVDEIRRHLEDIIGKRVQLNIMEIRQAELDAYLVARVVAEQIERRIAYRRAMKQAIFRTIQAGAKGIRVSCAGRLGGAEIARRQTMHQGQVPLHTLRADIDYGFTEARTTLGRIGVKVWIYKGDVLPEAKEVEEVEVEEIPAEAVAEVSAEVLPPTPMEKKETPAEAIAEPVAEVSAEVLPPTPVEKKETPAEAVAEPVATESVETPPAAEPKKKPTRGRPRRVKAAPSAESEESTSEVAADTITEAESSTSEEEEKDVTTQAGEIPQDS